MHLYARKVFGILFLMGGQALMAAPVLPPREINASSSQLHLLDSGHIAQAERRPWHPAELVAILGDQKGHHWQYLEGPAYSRDGKRIATLSRGHVCVWEAPYLRFQALLPIHAAFMQFVPQGNELLTCSKDGIVRLWDVSGVKLRSRVVMKGVRGDFTRVALAPNGQRLVVSSPEGLNFVDLSTPTPKGGAISLGARMSLQAVSISPDARTLAILKARVDWSTVGYISNPLIFDQEASLWDLSSEKPKVHAILTGPSGQWGPFAFSPDGKTLVCGANVWDLTGVEPKFRGSMNDQYKDLEQYEYVQGCLFLPGSREAITADYKESRMHICVRDMRKRVPQILQTVSISDRYFRGMALSPDAKYLAVGEVNYLHLWQIKEGKIQTTLPSHGHTQEVNAISFGACGNLLATVGKDASLRLWDLDGPRPRERLVHEREGASWDMVALSPDGAKLATGFRQWGFTLWAVSPAGLRVLAEHKGGGDALVFAPDSKTLFVGGDFNAIKVIDVSKPTEVATVLRPGRGTGNRIVRALAVSPDGKTLAAAEDDEIELWRRTENGWKKPSNFRANIFYTATSMSFGPDSTTLLVGGFNKTGQVRLFDVSGEKAEQITAIDGHKAAVLSVSASSNGKLVASTDEGGHVIVSSIGGEKLHEWTFPGPVRCVAFAPDGQHLALGNGDGTVYILRLKPPQRK